MIGEAYFRLLGGTNGFHAKAENERFSAVGLGCRQNPKHENVNSSFGRLRQKKLLQKAACRTCNTIIFHHSTNQIIDLWRCRQCHHHFLNSVISRCCWLRNRNLSACRTCSVQAPILIIWQAPQVCEQYAANSVFWLATRAGKMDWYCPPGTACFGPANKISP